MVDSTKQEVREALAAMSTLKRAVGIPNHSTRTDEFDDDNLHIYTPDNESAQLIGELLYRYGNGPRESFYNSHPEKRTIRDSVLVKPLEEGGYETSMYVPHASHITKALQKMVNKYIAPDRKFTR